MNPQEAHQLANPEILYFLKLQKSFILRREAKLVLKGILIAQEKELEVLDDLDISEMSPYMHNILATRRQALKISCENLRRVLK